MHIPQGKHSHLSELKSCSTALQFSRNGTRRLSLNGSDSWPKELSFSPKVSGFHDLIHYQCLQIPNAIAIETAQRSITYQEYWNLVLLNASVLRNHGVLPGTYVPIIANQSVAGCIAMVAAMKLGAVAVPLNVSFPKLRLESIVKRLNSTVCFFGSSSDMPTQFAGCKTLAVQQELLNQEISQAGFEETSHESAALLMFTSGSSGKPKGVVHPHRSVGTMAISVGMELKISQKSKSFHFAAFGWALSIIDTFSSLVNGACLYIPTEFERVYDLKGALQRSHATNLMVTPSVLASIDPEGLANLQTVMIAGEGVTGNLTKVWVPRVNLIWNYGSSEVFAFLFAKLAEDYTPGTTPAATGSGATCHLINETDGRYVTTPGQIGEMVVSGPTVATCYLDKESDAFAYQPKADGRDERFSELEVTPIFRTGDLFKYHSPNRFILVGRKDAQLKVRGQRLEPTEVEYHLRKHASGVRELAVTLATTKGSRNPLLVVLFAISNATENAESRETARLRAIEVLRSTYNELKDTLPSFMIPNSAFLVEDLPRLLNGKLDRLSLAKMVEDVSPTDLIPLLGQSSSSSASASRFYVQTLKQLWAQVLGLSEANLDLNSNFLLLGGDSLLAIRLSQALRKKGLFLNTYQIFHTSSLGVMAAAITDLSARGLEDGTKLPTPFSMVPNLEASEILQTATNQCQTQVGAVENIYPCTPTQEGLMSLSLHEPGAYICEHSFRLRSNVDLNTFEAAWERVMKAVPVLRTRIVQSDSGKFYNVTLTTGETEMSRCQKRSTKVKSSMSLGMPLFETSIDKDSVDGHFWRWRIHHAIYDRWSTGLIWRCLQISYTTNHLQPQNDFSLFVHEISKLDQEVSKDYWRSQFETYKGMEFPRLPWPGYRASPRSRAVRHTPKSSRASPITLSTVIRSALSLLISRQAGVSDLVIGATLGGRAVAIPDVDTIIGPTISTVPVRTQIDTNTKVFDFLCTAQEQAAQMTQHEHFGLQNIRELGAGAAQASLFQTLLIIQPALDTSQWTDLAEQDDLDSSNDYLTYPLTFECLITESEIVIQAHYDSNVLTDRQVQLLLRQLDHFVTKLQDESQQGRKLSHIDPFSEEDKAEVLQWNSVLPVRHNECLHTVLLERAKMYSPEDIAVRSWDEELAYGQLLQQSGRLSQLLISRGAGRGQFIPICHERSSLVVVAMIAILRTGAAFLLLDAQLPAERVSYMLETVQASMVLCSSKSSKLFTSYNIKTMALDTALPKEMDNFNTSFDDPISSPNDPAYCIFTSGSTGRPKAAVFLHHQATSGLLSQIAAGLFPPRTKLLQFCSFAFDTVIADIFCPLLTNGCICIPHEDERLADLEGAINRFDADIIDLIPSVANTLDPVKVPSLKILRLGGECMPAAQVKKWANKLLLQNTYGPCECCVQCTLLDNINAQTNTSSIGRGFGCLTWIVDSDTREFLAPVGVVGELALQGPMVCNGYLNNASSTASSFLDQAPWLDTYSVPNNFRTYMTGDLVRYDDDGSLLFMGRKDNQVKLRGQRVELGEIESLISTQSQVKHSQVALPSTGQYADRLTAVICLHKTLEPKKSNTCQLLPASSYSADHKFAIQEVDSMLQKLLPAYMVPSAYLILVSMPFLPSGKLHRSAIEKWCNSLDADAISSSYVYQPSNDLETETHMEEENHTSVAIRKKVNSLLLGKTEKSGSHQSSSGRETSFYRSGLDSIRIISLLHWINKEFKVKLSVSDLVQHDSARKVARLIDNTRAQIHPISGSDIPSNELIDTINHEVERLRGINFGNQTSGPSQIFLTGVTGFLGIHILESLLRDFPDANICVLVRAQTIESGYGILAQTADKAGLRQAFEDGKSRIEVWLGDLGHARLGLNQQQWRRLNGSDPDCKSSSCKGHSNSVIDAVLHVGANVNWMTSYENLRDVNVKSTLTLLEIAGKSQNLHRFIYVSGGPQWHPDKDEDSDNELKRVLSTTNGYGQSKLVAEQIVVRISQSSPVLKNKVVVVKPGLVMGSESRGIANLDDFIWRLVAGCVSIGKYFEEPDNRWIYISTCDEFASKVCNTLNPSSDGCALGPTPRLKILDGLSVSSFWSAVTRTMKSLGLKLDPVDYNTWHRLLVADVDARGSLHPCWSVMEMIEGGPSVLGSIRSSAASDNTSLEASNLYMESAVRRNIMFLHDSGFFSDTSQNRATGYLADAYFCRRAAA